MSDVLTRFGTSLIQHGAFSDRVYALKLDPGEMPEVLDALEALATEEGYGKIIAKGRREDFRAFTARDYQPEAVVPHFFGPGKDGVFMGKFLDPQRAREEDLRRIQDVLRRAQAEWKRAQETPDAASGSEVGGGAEAGSAELREATADEMADLAGCYGKVFESYPFPIQDPDHLREEQERGTRYFGAWDAEALVAASSMEPGGPPGVVEMTDFATLPSHRGQGLATRLLALMDAAAEEAGKRLSYTIARAVSFGMNITFARRGYTFGGTLVNNTQISGSIESMNVWYKLLTI